MVGSMSPLSISQGTPLEKGGFSFGRLKRHPHRLCQGWRVKRSQQQKSDFCLWNELTVSFLHVEILLSFTSPAAGLVLPHRSLAANILAERHAGSVWWEGGRTQEEMGGGKRER